jgi:DNA-binding Lrp family transcriptional regulator
MKLDMYDKRILESFIGDSRKKITSLSSVVKLSRENVHYRVQRMVQGGLIKEFNSIISE